MTPLIPKGSTQCESTDELLGEFEKVNEERDADRRWVVGSLDVVSLYPSLDVDVCAKVVAETMMESDMVLKNLKWLDIALYLKYHMDPDFMDVVGLSDVVPRRKYDRRPPIFECSGSNLDKAVRFEPWIFPEVVPGEEVVRRMFCIAVGIMVKKTMALHDFVIDGRMFRQNKGGSIGLDLTGVVSDIFMCRWDKRLLESMAREEISAVVYGRYKDDVDFVLEAGGAEEETEVGEDRDRRVMEKVKVLADGVHPSIKVEVDCGYNHQERNGRLPVLDVEVWIGETEDGRLKILHSHYVKEVSSRLVMVNRSAHGESTKRNVMVNEVGRILKNCSVYLPWEVAANKVSYFVKRMEFSGYSEEFRFEVVEMAVRRHERKVKQWREGRALYARSRDDRRRVTDKTEKRRGWYKRDGKYDSVMFVQPTKDGELKRKVQEVARRNGVKVKVVERAGLTMKKVLQRSDPYGKKDCGRSDCPVCQFGQVGVCRSRGCGYQLKCKADSRKYKGQTGRSVYERVKEEMRDWEKKDEKSPLWRHSQLFHQGRGFVLEVKVIDRSFGKPSRRLITEAVEIEKLKEDETMNSKQEWTYVKLNKVQVG